MCVRGPNGFLRHFTGDTRHDEPEVEVTAAHKAQGAGHLLLQMTNPGHSPVRVSSTDAYQEDTIRMVLPGGQRSTFRLPCGQNHHWYDVTITSDLHPAYRQRLCGHIETGHHSTSDPAFGHVPLQAAEVPRPPARTGG
ncbi:phospholipase domain-containing protein [Streptomyces lavendofoliae]|uniref:phospholipase domain-containing protein n=1 Tax=Streptomyces lavendofoliae TaxID=67314 RepID=UPI003D8F8B1E